MGSAMLSSVPAGSEKGARTEKAEVKTRLGKLNSSKVNPSTAGKTKTDVVAGSGVRRIGPSFEWVKTKRDENGFHPIVSNIGCRNEIFPPTGSRVSSGTTVKQMGEAGGLITVFSQPTSDLGCSTPQTQAPGDKISILGLDDKDFPPIRPLSDFDISREASKFGDGSMTLNSAPTHSQSI